MTTFNDSDAIDSSAIAIIGMSGRFPGAGNVDELWRKLCDGEELITFFSDEELLEAGVEPNLLNNPNYVKASPTLAGLDKFDAYFFDYSAKEALYMDPQQRVFLECAWEALENSGYQAGSNEYTIGVYGGSTLSIYLLNNIIHDNRVYAGHLTSSKDAIVFGGNVPEALTTRVAYKLNLTGPAVHFSTACSTSLVAVHHACQSLLNGECEMALAGGVSYLGSQNQGYLYEEGLVLSPDGHCRSFDAKAKGTLWGNGVGIVVLKLLEDALADGDHIHAVIKGSSINNDGNLKVSHSAPSVDAQARAIYQAQEIADIDPESIGYIEAHGTATPLGDPIEIAALTQAFRAKTDKKTYCAIGSIKSNMGHLSEAAGIVSLIKTALVLKHKQIPPSLHFKTPNPEIDFENSPFYVNTELKDWISLGYPRRAGVSSFGLGGTNAHIVLEEWDEPADSSAAKRQQQLLLLSAKTPTALEAITVNLANHFNRHLDLNLEDAAYTLTYGRKAFGHRRIAVVSNQPEAAAKTLSPRDNQRVFTNSGEVKPHPVTFMFTGQGSQYVNMARELYETEAVFRDEVDKCCALLKSHLDLDLRAILYPAPEDTEAATATLTQTSITQPALFVTEYALAQLWMSWGVKPDALIGHSIGEYVAATLAGVFSLEDALLLVSVRGRLMQSMPAGGMLAVPLPEEQVRPLLVGTRLEIATVNSPNNCVVSGEMDDIESFFSQTLAAKAIEGQRLHTSHAFHSRMMEPILETFTHQVRQIELNAPTIPFISNLTGTWITDEEATNPAYYAQQLRSCVRFADGLKQLFDKPERILLEVGPGRTLSSFAKRHPDKPKAQLTFTSVRPPKESISDLTLLLKTLGQLWLYGVDIDWEAYYGEDGHSRVPLPTYPFEHHRYWMEAKRSASLEPAYTGKKPDIADWFYEASWKRVNLLAGQQKSLAAPVLVFADQNGYGEQLIAQLATQVNEADIITVNSGENFEQLNPKLFSINPAHSQDYHSLIQTLQARELMPATIIHLWNVTDKDASTLDVDSIETSQNNGFYSLLYLAQALGQHNTDNRIELLVVSSQLQNITGEETVSPLKATIMGPVRVIPREYDNIQCRSVDIAFSPQNSARVIAQLVNELQHDADDSIIAYRGNTRWVESFEPQHLGKPADSVTELPFKPQGVYLITGGMGGMGLVFAEHLAKTVQARLVLTARSALPERDAWEDWLANHTEEDPSSIKINKIKLMEAMGARVLVCRADVANQVQMAAVIAQARQEFGEINGVIHTAGVAGGGVIPLKTRDIAHNVLAPKVAGTLILDTLFKDSALDFMVVCSSMEAALGTAGQVDYCAANSFLDAYAQAKAGDPERLTLSINWDAWQEVGMAVETAKYGLDNKILEIKKLDHHLFDKCIVERNREVYLTKLVPDKHWIIGEHIVLNTPSLVGTAYLEIARSAYECHSGQSTMELQDVYFLKFLFVEKGEEKEVRTILTPTDNGAEFSIQSLDAESSEWFVHAQGKVVPKDFPEPVTYDVEALEAGCDQNIEVPDLQALPDYTRYGSRWLHNIQWRKANEHHNLALMELPQEFAQDVEFYKFHPSLVDTATYVVADVLPNELTSQFDFFTESSAYLPYFYERVAIKGALPTRFYSYTTRELQGHDWSINLSFMNPDGVELVSIKNYLLKYIDSAYTLKDDQKSRESQQRHAKSVDASLANAILPQEGIDSLQRLLLNRLPQVLVSTTDFHYQRQLLKQKPEEAEDEEALFERPQLTQAYAAPQSPVEQAIAKIWEQVLGIKDIGVNDNFFDLGGDSLIIVQILQKLRQTLKDDLSINDLLNANTIAELARVIEPPVEGAQGLPACLVRFRAGNSQMTPIFLVHPIAGNTHNYVNLPNELDPEQPIYALQHPKWTGEKQSFDSIEAIAAHYLQAVRQVQPKGPYNIAGYSGGVYITYEMAQQLTTQGEDVGFLGLIDKPHWETDADKPNWNSPEFGTPLETMVYFADLRTPKANGESHLAEYQQFDSFDEQLNYFIKNSPWIHAMLPADATLEDWKQFWEVFVELRVMNVNYSPKTYHGPTVYYAAAERDIYYPKLDEKPWFKFVPKLIFEEVPGDHVTMWHQPNVQVLAQKMKQYFCQAPQTQNVTGVSHTPTVNQVELSKDFLLETAQQKAGLNDFGDQRFLAGLDQLLDSIKKESQLHTMGRNLVQQLIIRLLVNRLQMQNEFKQHPDILQTPIKQPLFIMGLPRTGSTYLHNLLAQDPNSRWLHLWEAYTPSPAPDPQTLATDPRIKRAQESFKAYEVFNPESTAMHKYDVNAPEECLWLLQHDFTCISFSFLMSIPSYTEWLKAQDMTPVYAYYRQQLQLLSWKWPTDHWLLKNPFHAADLSALMTVFPDAHLIQTHRDPLKVTASYSRLIEKLRTAYSDKVDKQLIAKEILDMLVWQVEQGMKARTTIPNRQITDIRFDDLVNDPIGTVQKIYDYFGYDLSQKMIGNLDDYITENPRYIHGKYTYSLEEFGLDTEGVNERFNEYLKNNGVL